MNLKKTLALALVLAAAVGYILYVEIPRGEEEAKEDQVFADVPRTRMEQIVITRAADKTSFINLQPEKAPADKSAAEVSLDEKKEIDRWQFGEIAGAKLESGPFTALTSALVALKLGKPLPKADIDSDLSVYGLKTPELAIQIKGTKKDATALEATLKFGKKNDFVQQRYVQLERSGDSPDSGPFIYLVPETLFMSANKSGPDFRSKSIVTFADADLKSMRFQSAFGPIAMEADAAPAQFPLRQTKWKVTESPLSQSGLRASDEKVAEVLRELRNSKAAAFIDGEEAKDLSRYGFSDSAPSLHLEFSKRSDSAGAPATLDVRIVSLKDKDSFGRGPGSYLSVSGLGTLFWSDVDIGAKVFKGIGDLRDREFLKFSPSTLAGVEIIKGESALSLKKDEKGVWLLSQKDSPEVNAEPQKVEQYLSDLSALKADSFAEESVDFGFAAPSAKVVLHLKDAGKSETTDVSLLIGRAASGAAGSGTPEGSYAGVLVGASDPQTLPGQAFVLKADQVAKFLPLREALLPAPAPQAAAAQSSAEASSAAAAGASALTQQ